MRRSIVLVRHGETEWNRLGRWQGRTDVPLSDRGRAQAVALAGRLRGQCVTHIVSSDLLRARETAEILSRALGVPLLAADPDLRERGFGCFEGLTREECAARFADAWQAYRADPRIMPPGGESHDEVVARMRRGYHRLHAALTAETDVGVLVSHGGSLRALVGALTGTMPGPMGNTECIRLVTEGSAVQQLERLAAADE